MSTKSISFYIVKSLKSTLAQVKKYFLLSHPLSFIQNSQILWLQHTYKTISVCTVVHNKFLRFSSIRVTQFRGFLWEWFDSGQTSKSKIAFLRVEFLSNQCIQTQILIAKSLLRIKSKSEMEILRVILSTAD